MRLLVRIIWATRCCLQIMGAYRAGVAIKGDDCLGNSRVE